MVEVFKILFLRRRSSDAIYQARFFRAFTENCGYNAFVAMASATFEWFDASTFNILNAAVFSGASERLERRRVRALSALIVLFVLTEQLSLAWLGRAYFWKPSLGRWFVIQTATLYWNAYWTLFARQTVALLLTAFACRLHSRAFASRRSADFGSANRSLDAEPVSSARVSRLFPVRAEYSRKRRLKRPSRVVRALLTAS